MPLVKVKLLSDKSLADLKEEIADYKAGDGSALDTAQRGMALAMAEAAGVGKQFYAALAHGGLDTPASGNKTADLQHVIVDVDGPLADLQEAIDDALSDVVHSSVNDADTTVAGTVTSVTAPFEAEDVGRKIRIGDEVRTITAFTDADEVDYDNSDAAGGNFTSGTGLTLELLGAEVLQDLQLVAYKEADADQRIVALLACEGELG